MKAVTQENTSHFPAYALSATILKSAPSPLLKSNQWTREAITTTWHNESKEELVMLWLWHNGEVREFYRLDPMTVTKTTVLHGMGIMIVSEATHRCLYNQVITETVAHDF
jgi:hypothetical protein